MSRKEKYRSLKEQFRYNKTFPCSGKKPASFVIVRIFDERGKSQNGWWTGKRWDFGLQRIGEPFKWQRIADYNNQCLGVKSNA